MLDETTICQSWRVFWDSAVVVQWLTTKQWMTNATLSLGHYIGLYSTPMTFVHVTVSIHRVQIKIRFHWFFHNNFYKYARIFMFFGTQLCKWILIILVNLLRCVPCTSLTWWRNVDVTEIMPFTVHVTVTIITTVKAETPYFIPPEMWPPNSPDLNPVDYSIWDIFQGRVYRSRIHDVHERVEITSAERVEAAGPHRHHDCDCAMA